MGPFAHSARPKQGIPAQPYFEHIAEVRRIAAENAGNALRFHTGGGASWIGPSADWAACFHDLGKLHPENQRTLAGNRRNESLAVNHVDAGTAHLIRSGLRESAIAIYGHHVGLVDCPAEQAKLHRQSLPFRDEAIWRRVDKELEQLLWSHRNATAPDPELCEKPSEVSGLNRRLLLSCLVDADHSDTARNYREYTETDSPATRWEERRKSLDHYVSKLGANTDERTSYRNAVYAACREGNTSQAFFACDSPVGSGKTTAVMAYLLRAAEGLRLRHIFVVLPYTSIIRQSVEVYRKALCLPGEDPESIVAAHHHLAEFSKIETRHLTTLWKAPVIVTTAVQFFETLGAASTSRLRKLHALPGSAIFVDEAHAAMPVHLWPYMWNQLDELAEKWTCRFVLGSGSLARFWENGRIADRLVRPRKVPMLTPPDVRSGGQQAETGRVTYRTRDGALNLEALVQWVEESPGPRLLVMNTVQSAAVVARELSRRNGDVLHLSTALSPTDRGAIVERIEQKLDLEGCGDWTLVATSCVEAGLDFDFAIGFRERSRAASLVQLGGRVNRHARRGLATVWDFVTSDPMLTQHPEFQSTSGVVRQLFAEGLWNRLDPTELMTIALERELIEKSAESKIADLEKSDRALNYKTLADLTRLIQSDTRLVIVDRELISLLEAGQKLSHRRLLAGSVQLWAKKIGNLKLSIVGGLPDVYRWDYDYDSEFLGVMAGMLKLSEADRDGYHLL